MFGLLMSPKKMVFVALAFMASFLMLSASWAQVDIKMNDEEKGIADTLIKRLQDLRGAKEVDVSVKKTSFDLYEVVIDGSSFAYTNKNADFILSGRLMDGKTLNDLTAISEEKYDSVDVKKLPLRNAVKIGNGKNVIYTFEDPRCGYCKKLAQDLSQIKDLTIYTFVVGFLGPDSDVQAKSIMCNRKPDEAWLNTMLRNSPPANSAGDNKCEDKLRDNNSLARKLRVQGTPAIIFADGSRFKGYVPKEGIEGKIKEVNLAKK